MANQSPNQPISQAAAGTLVGVIGGIPGVKYRCLGLWGSMSANGTVQFKSHVSGTLVTGNMTLTSGQPFSSGPVSIENGEGLFEVPVGESLDMVTTGGAFNGFISGQYVPG